MWPPRGRPVDIERVLCGPCTPQSGCRRGGSGRRPASGSALPAWEQEVQSSKHQTGRQHPVVLALEVKRGPLRTSFPNRTCLLQAGLPSARQPPRPNPAAASQWTSVGLTRLPVQTRLQTLLRSRAMAAYRSPTVPLASKATGKHVPQKPNRGGAQS